ncbi:MAG TPA: NAD-dependent isocitrate dehydrogenase, partial [candidate division Zixibacteria bacterium]|nr:NAD-dependent isocitrate dehydrogenase [candidate division Zixibacteria bacterium]
MTHKVTLIPGDGIGPEITESVVRVIEAAGVDIKWDRQLAGIPAVQEYGVSVPDQCLDSIKENKVALKGPLTTLVGKGFRSANVTLRRKLDLYANLRPVKTIGGVPSRFDKV